MKNLIYYSIIVVTIGFTFFYFRSTEDNKLRNEVFNYRFHQKNTLTKEGIIKAEDSLTYFKVNPTFRVNAKIKIIEEKLDTTYYYRSKLDIITISNKIICFKLKNRWHELPVFETPNKDLIIPFTDCSNDLSTSKFGRLLPYEFVEKNLVIDFNLAYNPACEYASKFDCIIVPKSSHIPIVVDAGEKHFSF